MKMGLSEARQTMVIMASSAVACALHQSTCITHVWPF